MDFKSTNIYALAIISILHSNLEPQINYIPTFMNFPILQLLNNDVILYPPLIFEDHAHQFIT